MSVPGSAEYAAVAKQIAEMKSTKQIARRKPKVCTMPPTKQSRCHLQETDFVGKSGVKGLRGVSKSQTVATFTGVFVHIDDSMISGDSGLALGGW